MSTIDRSLYPGIPEDFPIVAQSFALAGSQPKLNLVEHDDNYYAAGTSPPEVLQDYEVMRDLAQQMVAFSISKGETNPDALARMLSKESMDMQFHYGFHPAHVAWVMARVRTLLQEAGHPAADSDFPPLPSDAP